MRSTFPLTATIHRKRFRVHLATPAEWATTKAKPADRAYVFPNHRLIYINAAIATPAGWPALLAILRRIVSPDRIERHAKPTRKPRPAALRAGGLQEYPDVQTVDVGGLAYALRIVGADRWRYRCYHAHIDHDARVLSVNAGLVPPRDFWLIVNRMIAETLAMMVPGVAPQPTIEAPPVIVPAGERLFLNGLEFLLIIDDKAGEILASSLIPADRLHEFVDLLLNDARHRRLFVARTARPPLQIADWGEGRRTPCPFCPKSFVRPGASRAHLVRKHGLTEADVDEMVATDFLRWQMARELQRTRALAR